ncbi:MAG: hypothetical protein JWM31_2725 [Solirubrobacterales bacterium]|nr:hypothetical protein [Solirubrobacterales bacterium]
MSATVIRRSITVGILALAAFLVVRSFSADGPKHTLVAHFRSATNVIRDQEVRIGGVRVGHVSGVDLQNGDAVVKLQIDDSRVWPLHRGTRAALRFGTTVADGGRFIELRPGPTSAADMLDNAILTEAQTVSPVEFDDVFNTFDAATRKDLRGLLDNTADTFAGQGPAVTAGLDRTPAGLDAASSIMDQLAADRTNLAGLVRSADRTTEALAQRDPELQRLLGNSASTFDELASKATAIKQSLTDAPATLTRANGTLANVDGTLGHLDGLVSDLRPGASALKDLAPSAERAVTLLSRVAPLASGTLATATRAAPSISSLLKTGTPVVGLAGKVAHAAGADLACVRPYIPDVSAFLSNWAGFAANTDDQGHYMRAQIQATPVPNGTPLTSKQSIDALGLGYAFPTPAGWSAGQSWFQPGCGSGPDALDAAKDPETVK